MVFEPHTFTWRNRTALTQYDTAFDGADKVYIYEPAQQGAGTHAQLSQEEIVERVQASGVQVEPIQSVEAGLRKILDEASENDAILLLTSGDLGGLIKSIPEEIERHFPAR